MKWTESVQSKATVEQHGRGTKSDLVTEKGNRGQRPRQPMAF